MRDGLQSGIHQVGSVHHGLNLHPVWQCPLRIEFVHGSMHLFQDGRRILVAQHLHDTLHAVGLMNRVVVIAQRPFAL